ncbi:MAG TPA: hypothetical protein VM598_14930, partial [Bdellovibrionota bacterium]|nr:hypothetical protein [Bdellovibrionota bacterium]
MVRPVPAAPPIVQGPLWQLDQVRDRLVDEVSLRTIQELSGSPLDFLLGEALYSESVRLRRDHGNIFTQGRRKHDKRMLSKLKKGLVRGPAESDRRLLLDTTVRHYAEEIAGRFNPEVYRFATHALPLGFNWLVNAASVKQFLPWKQTEILTSRLNIFGEVEQLRNLSK